jgi:hypothetical protein
LKRRLADSLGIDLGDPAELNRVVFHDSGEAVSLMNQWHIKLVYFCKVVHPFWEYFPQNQIAWVFSISCLSVTIHHHLELSLSQSGARLPLEAVHSRRPLGSRSVRPDEPRLPNAVPAVSL